MNNLITRAQKGSPLTADDHDNNLIEINKRTKPFMLIDAKLTKNFNIPLSNDTDSEIFVILSPSSGSTGVFNIEVDDEVIAQSVEDSTTDNTITAIIPANSIYQINTSNYRSLFYHEAIRK